MQKELKCSKRDGMSSIAENSEQLRNFLKGELPENVRILVNGSNGWLGKNISDSLWEIFGPSFDSHVLLTGSRNGILSLQSGIELRVSTWSRELVETFKPTHIVQLAFKTRDHVSDLSNEAYVSLNEYIIDSALWMISLPSVQGFLHTSSGAALGNTAHSKLSDPYGYLKKFEETQYARACEINGKTYVGIRVWSASGRYIKTGGLFALESFISQALTMNEIRIGNAAAVTRSFVDANEILLAGLIALFDEAQGIYNSGGSPVEIGSLANLVGEVSPRGKPKIIRPLVETGSESYYCSIEPSIEQVLISHNLQYSELRAQVINTMQYLIWLDSQQNLSH